MTVTAHTLDQRMPVEAVPVEFAGLAERLNTMLARLQADFARLQKFFSDLAQERRSSSAWLTVSTNAANNVLKGCVIWSGVAA